MEPASTFVGVGVSRTQLSVIEHPTGMERNFPDTGTGIAALSDHLQTVHPRAIALESMVGDQGPVVGSLVEAMLPVIVVNPRRVRDFVLETGLLTQEAPFSITNAIEAGMLTRFAETLRATV